MRINFETMKHFETDIIFKGEVDLADYTENMESIIMDITKFDDLSQVVDRAEYYFNKLDDFEKDLDIHNECISTEGFAAAGAIVIAIIVAIYTLIAVIFSKIVGAASSVSSTSGSISSSSNDSLADVIEKQHAKQQREYKDSAKRAKKAAEEYKKAAKATEDAFARANQRRTAGDTKSAEKAERDAAKSAKAAKDAKAAEQAEAKRTGWMNESIWYYDYKDKFKDVSDCTTELRKVLMYYANVINEYEQEELPALRGLLEIVESTIKNATLSEVSDLIEATSESETTYDEYKRNARYGAPSTVRKLGLRMINVSDTNRFQTKVRLNDLNEHKSYVTRKDLVVSRVLKDLDIMKYDTANLLKGTAGNAEIIDSISTDVTAKIKRAGENIKKFGSIVMNQSVPEDQYNSVRSGVSTSAKRVRSCYQVVAAELIILLETHRWVNTYADTAIRGADRGLNQLKDILKEPKFN